MTISTNRDSDRFMLRLPDGMRDRIKQAAERNNRSMNAEIIARLEASFSAKIGDHSPYISHEELKLVSDAIVKSLKESGVIIERPSPTKPDK